MTLENELRDQLVGLVEARCLDPLEILFQDGEALLGLRDRLRTNATEWARTILGADDDAAVAAIVRVVATLYPGDAPFSPPVAWWRTAMGQATARRVGHPTADRVSYPVAGAMLKITRQGVHDLVNRGKLERHPDGGVTPASIRDRLRAQAAATSPSRHQAHP